MTRHGTTAVFLTAALAGSTAHAQFMHETGGWRLGVERLTGAGFVSVTHDTTSGSGSGVTVTGTSTVSGPYVHVLASDALSAQASTGEGLVTASPRIAVDYSFPMHLTLGGTVGLMYTAPGSSSTVGGTTSTGTLPSYLGIGLGVRVGYEIALGDHWTFWPRAGVTWAQASASASTMGGSTSSSDLHEFWVNLEPTLVWEPVSHVGFLTSIVADLPLGGGASVTTTTPVGSATVSTGFSALMIGLELGMQARF